MTEHLSKKELEQLSKYEVHGENLVDALEHLEMCESCRLSLPKPSVEEVIDRLNIDQHEREINEIKKLIITG